MSRAARRFTVKRVTDPPTRELVYTGQTEREARTHVAWCANDNLDMPRKDAARAADAAPVDGTPYPLAHYTFTITPEPAP